MAEYPPLGKSFVLSYSNNDRDFPIVAIRKDPRVDNYRIPEDLSPHPDSKRWPNHVFTGAQPTNSDERVQWIYEILPSPWVPFTRYDDDLGPIQGRRRSVKNEGQVASLTADKRTTYEAREGSAIVYTELEETWSIKVDEDGNSLFPIRDRDFYDPSRGPVQERRQLFVPTGEEVGSLENVNGVITQTSYEPYNEFLSVKIVQTYKVNGPQLIGRATDNDGQLVTVTTQRKGADGYIPPNPTATRTVEVSREDAESLVERIVDTPEVFKANTFSVERPDPIPQKFRVAVPIQSSQEIVEGIAEIPTLKEGEISKSQEQRNKFIKRISSTVRDQAVLPKTLISKTTNNERQEVTITETLQFGDTDEKPTATTTIESEALGDENYVITKTEVPEVFAGITFSVERPDPIPQKFRVSIPIITQQETIEGVAETPKLDSPNLLSKSEQQVTEFVKRTSATFRSIAEERKIFGLLFTSEMGGGMANVEEIFPLDEADFDSAKSKKIEFGTISDEIENLGNDQRVRKKITLEPKLESLDFGPDEEIISAKTLPVLRGQEYDDALDIVIPYKQVVVSPENQSLSTGNRKRITPRDVAHSTVIKYDVKDVQKDLDEYYWEVPEMVQIALPDKLISVSCPIESSGGTGEGTGFGDTWFYNFSSSFSRRGKIIYDIEEGFRGNIPAVRAIFFLPKENCSPQRVLQVVRSNSPNQFDSEIQFYPNVRPQSHELVVFGESSSGENSKSVSFDSGSSSTSKSGSFTIDSTIIPPTIHEKIRISSDISGQDVNAAAYVRPNELPATQPYEIFPVGKFIYQINSNPYRFGYVRVEAVIIEITQEYV